MSRLKGLENSMLLEFYGSLLTEKQHEVLDMYYNLDYSLSEIAENIGVTRQGVLDTIKRGEAKLSELEEHLRIKQRYDATEINLLALEQALEDKSKDPQKEARAAIKRLRAVWED